MSVLCWGIWFLILSPEMNQCDRFSPLSRHVILPLLFHSKFNSFSIPLFSLSFLAHLSLPPLILLLSYTVILPLSPSTVLFLSLQSSPPSLHISSLPSPPSAETTKFPHFILSPFPAATSSLSSPSLATRLPLPPSLPGADVDVNGSPGKVGKSSSRLFVNTPGPGARVARQSPEETHSLVSTIISCWFAIVPKELYSIFF